MWPLSPWADCGVSRCSWDTRFISGAGGRGLCIRTAHWLRQLVSHLDDSSSSTFSSAPYRTSEERVARSSPSVYTWGHQPLLPSSDHTLLFFGSSQSAPPSCLSDIQQRTDFLCGHVAPWIPLPHRRPMGTGRITEEKGPCTQCMLTIDTWSPACVPLAGDSSPHLDQ